MKKLIVAFPSFFILLPMILEIALDSGVYCNLKGLVIVGMVLINPLLILLQGYLSGKFKINIKTSLGTTLIVYFITVFAFLNSSALGYPVIGGIFGSIGYFIGKRKVAYN